MKYILIKHARERLEERKIQESLIQEALEKPTKTIYDNKGRILVKKLYTRQGKQRLLLIAGEIAKDTFVVITIIDTTKIKKYL